MLKLFIQVSSDKEADMQVMVESINHMVNQLYQQLPGLKVDVKDSLVEADGVTMTQAISLEFQDKEENKS